MIINRLPLFVGASDTKNNFNLPIEFKFDLYFDEELKMFRQTNSIELDALLQKIYSNGSLADGSFSSESGQKYIDKAIKYIENNSVIEEIQSILEIGVGLGVVISRLKETYPNKTYVGIEPGGYDINISNEIKIVRDFFPSNQIQGKFNLIYSLLVLEHVPDPLQFLLDIKTHLSVNGTIIIAVPNCEPYLNEGDISMLIHEHMSYFTQEAVIKLANKSNLSVKDISIIDGTIFFTLSEFDHKISNLYQRISEDFYVKKNKTESFISNNFKNYEQDKIAVYCPIRALNFLYLNDYNDVRLIDDSTEVQGKYLPGLNSKIESFQDLVFSPPELIFIYSRTFGTKIKEKCFKEKALNKTKIICVDEL